MGTRTRLAGILVVILAGCDAPWPPVVAHAHGVEYRTARSAPVPDDVLLLLGEARTRTLATLGVTSTADLRYAWFDAGSRESQLCGYGGRSCVGARWTASDVVFDEENAVWEPLMEVGPRAPVALLYGAEAMDLCWWTATTGATTTAHTLTVSELASADRPSVPGDPSPFAGIEQAASFVSFLIDTYGAAAVGRFFAAATSNDTTQLDEAARATLNVGFGVARDAWASSPPEPPYRHCRAALQCGAPELTLGAASSALGFQDHGTAHALRTFTLTTPSNVHADVGTAAGTTTVSGGPCDRQDWTGWGGWPADSLADVHLQAGRYYVEVQTVLADPSQDVVELPIRITATPLP